MSDDFTPIDAGVAHEAMIDMREAARKYEQRKPGCAQAQTFARKAADLKVLRDKILDRLPPQFHEHRKTYPDYHGYADAVRIEKGAG
jgi:hypothetical protein